jgi:hypothetical protein
MVGSTQGTCSIPPPPPGSGTGGTGAGGSGAGGSGAGGSGGSGTGGSSGTAGSTGSGGSGACALYGQQCSVSGDCCSGVPCTNGSCVFPIM